MTAKPRKPWRVIPTQNGIQLAEVEHTSEAKAFDHVRMALGSGADAAKVMQWEGGRWWHFETVTADEVPRRAVRTPTMSDGSSKIPEGVIQSGKIDPDDPLYVHTLITFALKKLGMSQEEADKYAAAHQQHAVDADRSTEQ